MEKILTIVIPTYNMEKYLDKCLSSLIVSDENMRQLEVLVINDGSKDRSSEIAHSYESRFPQTFRVIDKENGNYGSCVNRGFKEATGKYIKILDADDSFDTNIFDSFISYLTEEDVDLIISNYKVIDKKGKEIESSIFNLPTNCIFDLSKLSVDAILGIYHHCVTYRTEIVHNMNYHQTEGILYTDDEWIYIPMRLVKRASYFPNYLYLYLRGREGQSFDPQVLRKSFQHRVIVAKKLVEDYALYFNKNETGCERYRFIKLIGRLQPIYSFYLIKECSAEGNLLLKELDLTIKRLAPNIFEAIEDIRIRGIWKYVSNWRNSGYQNSTILLKFLRLSFKLYNLKK